jgi:hypothetical protein
MSYDDLAGLLILLTFFGLLGIEYLIPARIFDKAPYWTITGLAFFVMVMALTAPYRRCFPSTGCASTL